MVTSRNRRETGAPVGRDPGPKAIRLTKEPSVVALFVWELGFDACIHTDHKEVRVLRGFVLGIAVAIVAGLLFGYVGVTQGLLIPANADARPGKLEAWAARSSLHATLRREASKQENPLPATDQNLIAGIKLYGENCAVCHGVADGAASTIAVGLYQHAPQLGKHGVEDDSAGETYWKIDHGIRLTGMPAFGPTLKDEQLWQLTLFLQKMDTLSPAAQRVWKALKNPAPIAKQ